MGHTFSLMMIAAFGIVSTGQLHPVAAADEAGGKVTGKVFANWSWDFTDDSTITKRSAIDLTRAYLGYKHTFNETFTADVTLDVERVNEITAVTADTSRPPKLKTTTDARFEAFLKTASLEWKGLIPKTTLQAGLVPLFLFSLQEKFWGYRYIAKSHMDDKGYSSSADLGLTAKVKPIDQLQIDFNVSNGEGFKKAQDIDGIYKTALGIEVYPIGGLSLFLAGDYMPVVTKGSDSAATITATGFVGYDMKDKFRLGLEYDYQMNQKGFDSLDVSGVSVYGTFVILKGLEVFARYDLAMSRVDWNSTVDGHGIVGGIQYSPIKNVKIAADYQGLLLKKSGTIDKHKAFLHLEFGF